MKFLVLILFLTTITSGETGWLPAKLGWKRKKTPPLNHQQLIRSQRPSVLIPPEIVVPAIPVPADEAPPSITLKKGEEPDISVEPRNIPTKIPLFPPDYYIPGKNQLKTLLSTASVEVRLNDDWVHYADGSFVGQENALVVTLVTIDKEEYKRTTPRRLNLYENSSLDIDNQVAIKVVEKVNTKLSLKIFILPKAKLISEIYKVHPYTILSTDNMPVINLVVIANEAAYPCSIDREIVSEHLVTVKYTELEPTYPLKLGVALVGTKEKPYDLLIGLYYKSTGSQDWFYLVRGVSKLIL